ncbi:MAG: hypothetical protein ACTH3E_07245 [Psychroflexus halocasei]
MKYFSFLFALLFLISCQENQKKEPEQQNDKSNQVKVQKEPMLLSIAEAHGFKNWEKITSLEYTFNVDRGGKHMERSWIWHPKTGEVEMILDNEKTKLNTNDVSDDLADTHQKFINDKYWLLFPFHLVWDDGFSHEIKKNVKAPISGNESIQVTIQYNNNEGYTPGDKYKIYINNSYQIQEWGYYPSGQDEAATETTWEDYTTQEGLKIAQMHQNKDTSFKLYFTDLKIN